MELNVPSPSNRLRGSYGFHSQLVFLSPGHGANAAYQLITHNSIIIRGAAGGWGTGTGQGGVEGLRAVVAAAASWNQEKRQIFEVCSTGVFTKIIARLDSG